MTIVGASSAKQTSKGSVELLRNFCPSVMISRPTLIYSVALRLSDKKLQNFQGASITKFPSVLIKTHHVLSYFIFNLVIRVSRAVHAFLLLLRNIALFKLLFLVIQGLFHFGFFYIT